VALESVSRRSAAFVFIFVTVVLDMLAVGIIIPVLPKLIESFTEDTASAAHVVGLFATSWAVMQFLFSPLLGALSDRFGRRPVVLLSNLGLGLDYLVMALAPGLAVLFLGRLISGMTAASVTVASAYIADVTAPEKRAQTFGMLGAAFGAGFVLGPAVGGFLGSYNLHYPFYAAAAMSLANFVYGLLILPESLPPEQRRGLSWAKANPIGAFKFLARARSLWGLGLVHFLSQLAHAALPTVYVLYASYRYGWDSSQVGLLLTGVGIAAMIVQGGLVRPIVRRLGERGAMIAGLLCGAFGLSWYGLSWTGAMTWIGVPVDAFWGLFHASSQSMMTKRVSPAEQGELQGAISSISALAKIAGPAFFTAIFAFSIGPVNLPGLTFWIASAILLAACAIAGVVTSPAAPAGTSPRPS
jgi:MFS transporter, DHA1 family, tetracycline resistance protein